MLQYAFKSKKVIYFPHVAISLKKIVPLRKIVQKRFMLKGALPLEKSF